MPFYQKYILFSLSKIPWIHWAVIGFLSLAISLFLLAHKKEALYSAVALGITVFIGLFLLELAVVIRYCGIMPHGYGYDFGIGFHRLFHSGEPGRRELISNIVLFMPFGYFLSEYLSARKQLTIRRRLGYVTWISFGLSLCIECLQIVLRVGFFELTDLVMNICGGFLGAGIASLGRFIFVRKGERVSNHFHS